LTTATLKPIEEIRSFLNYHDYSLAIRRLLDMCLDSGNESLLREAIKLSRLYRTYKTVNNGEEIPELYAQAITLLQNVEQVTSASISNRKHLLSAKDITKTYAKSRFSLQPLNLEIYTGDILGVVGENGHGKTTLLRSLAGQLALDGGTLNYVQLDNPDHYAIKHHIAFIPQRIPRWYGQLKDNLHFSAAIAGITGAQNNLIVDFMLERLNLTDYALLNWNEISSGYRTRFEIARILLQRPSLLILDEPLANLDINAQQTILTDLRYMAKSVYQPMGVILSSQQLHEVEKIADTVLFIKQGVCLFRTGDASTPGYVLEIETNAARDELMQVLNNEDISIQFNGGFYTITSLALSTDEILRTLVNAGIRISYFRDITLSTKRFF
jgi:ABC-2 type transport system ATP-binding protein